MKKNTEPKKRKGRRYTGQLNRPIMRDRLRVLGDVRPRVLIAKLYGAPDPEAWEIALSGAVHDLVQEREQQLFTHYEIPFGDWRGLALALAREHVPAFRASVLSPNRKRLGRKPFWKSMPHRHLALIGAVELVKEGKKNLSDRAACKILAVNGKYTDAPWRRGKHITPAALYNRFLEALQIADQLTETGQVDALVAKAIEEYPLLGSKKPS